MKTFPYSPVHSDLQFPVQPDLQSGWIEYKDLLSVINVYSRHFDRNTRSDSGVCVVEKSVPPYHECRDSSASVGMTASRFAMTEIPPVQPDLQSGWIEYKDLLSVINVCSMHFSHYKCLYSHLLHCNLSNTEENPVHDKKSYIYMIDKRVFYIYLCGVNRNIEFYQHLIPKGTIFSTN